MEGIGWFMAIILGGIAGFIAEKIMNSDMGIIGNIVIGIVGALVLNAILGFVFGFTLYGWIGQSIVAVAGACLLIWVYRAIRARG